MLRSFFIYLSKAGWARRIVTHWKIAWRAASRFAAGETLQDAIQAIGVLNAKGIHATLDHLGEHTTNRDEAERATQDVLEMIDAIDQAGVKSNVSIKLSQIGMALDENLCVENLERILCHARDHSIFIRLDMEDSPWVDATLRIYREMRIHRGYENIGVVIQAYLYRSLEDVKDLEAVGTRIRLCKGAYQEPADVAFPKKSDVDANYDRLAEMLMDAALAFGKPESTLDGKFPPIPAIASHDPRRIEHARTYARKISLPKKAVEFQMLYGIRRDLQEQLAAEQYPVRVYVPFGTEWYPYYMRRLAERPANIWFFISNFFRK